MAIQEKNQESESFAPRSDKNKGGTKLVLLLQKVHSIGATTLLLRTGALRIRKLRTVIRGTDADDVCWLVAFQCLEVIINLCNYRNIIIYHCTYLVCRVHSTRHTIIVWYES